MMVEKYFQNPFLPDKKVKTVILDGRFSGRIKVSFEDLGIEVILTRANKRLYPAISFHPDILLHPVGGNRIVVNPDIDEVLTEKLVAKGFEVIFGESFLECNYPQNIAYNVARVGTFAFHNLKYTDRILREELENTGVTFVNVRQGYTKCSTAIVAQNAIITSDYGIAKAAEQKGIDVLLIEPGNIVLPGLNYGFIGGACGLISKDILAFTGEFINKLFFEKINQFLARYEVKSIFLSDEEICDIGSIVTIE